MPSSIDWALIVAPTITGSLSLVSSGLLVYLIAFSSGRRKSRNKVADRLVLGLSGMDMIFSAACIMSTFAGPTYLNASLGDQYYMVGNWCSCQAQGFLYVYGSMAPLYNAGLCIYYFLSLCLRMTDELIHKRIEPAIHISIWIYGAVTATVALAVDTIALQGYQGCMIHNYVGEPRCEAQPDIPECMRGDFNGALVVATLILVPQLIAVACIVVLMSLIYYKVRSFEVSTDGSPSRQTQSFEQNESGREMHSHYGYSSGDTLPTYPSRRRVCNRVSETGLSYVLAYLASYFFAFLQTFLGATDEPSVLQFLSSTITPLHGFWNFLIFVSSKIKAARYATPDLTWREALYQVLRPSWTPPRYLDEYK